MSIRRKTVLLATTGVLAVGGGGGAMLASASASSPASGGTAGHGTIQLTVTRPDGSTHTRPSRPIACANVTGTYVLRVAHRVGRRGRAVLTIPHYNGAGNYSADLRVSGHGLFRSFAESVKIPVTMTASGGSASITRTLPGIVHPSLKGKTVTVRAAWTCTP